MRRFRSERTLMRQIYKKMCLKLWGTERGFCNFKTTFSKFFLDFFKLSIVFFRFGVFGAVPARTVARKYSKYKAFLYVGL